MSVPVYPYGGGFVPSQILVPQQQVGQLPTGCGGPATWQAINALTPTLFRIASEQRAIYGTASEAILVNLLGKISFAASGNFRIRGHHGKVMPLILHLRYAGPPLSGKSDARDRFRAPIVEGMAGWKKSWQFENVTPPALLRKIRNGAVYAMLGTAEGRGHLGDNASGQLSRSFENLNDLYDGHVPVFDRADDNDEKMVVNAPESAIFVICVNTQNDKHRAWLDKNAKDAIESGNLYRLMMMVGDQIAVEGAGSQQPEMALLDYDQRMVELLASARHNLKAMPVSRLPVIEVLPESEEILRRAQERFVQMASAVLSPNHALAFAVRLAANTRRIAGCMHVFERYDGALSVDTMTRAATIAECFAAHWLASVFPPKPVSEVMHRGQRLLDALYDWARNMPHPSWRKSDVVALAPNFGWSEAEMKKAITTICGNGLAQVMTRIEGGRRVIVLELARTRATLFQPTGQPWLPGRH